MCAYLTKDTTTTRIQKYKNIHVDGSEEMRTERRIEIKSTRLTKVYAYVSCILDISEHNKTHTSAKRKRKEKKLSFSTCMLDTHYIYGACVPVRVCGHAEYFKWPFQSVHTHTTCINYPQFVVSIYMYVFLCIRSFAALERPHTFFQCARALAHNTFVHTIEK